MHILLVSDIHSNLAALNAVIKDAGAFDRIWCLGDIVGYGPEPNECIERLRSFEHLCLAGNHDLAVVGKANLADFNSDAKEAVAFTRHQLAPEHRAWLENLSPMLVTEHSATLVHASPCDPVWEYVVTPPIARASFECLGTRICLYGHTHQPVLFRKPEYEIGIFTETLQPNRPVSLVRDRLLINPGSVGQPRDDDPRAAYAIIDLELHIFTYRRVQYDVNATQKKIKQAGLPGNLGRRLRFGQ